jgi:sortase A
MTRRLLFGNVLVAAGALLLFQAVAHVATGWRAQAAGVEVSSVASPPVNHASPPPAEGDALGRLELPRIGLDVVVFEGTSEATLRKGPGHLSGTGWPGAGDPGGNCVIAGHRDSFFRRLEKARKGDLVRLRRPSGTSTFRLESRRIVGPQDVSVIAPTSEPHLTLITCYPFRWVGSAPQRLVWSAIPLEATSRAASPPGR